MNIILLGFKGVGKTFFGKKLAGLLKWEFLDTDALIEKLYIDLGHEYKKVYEIHNSIGEENFRKLEAQAIKTLSLKEKRIISLGGGTLLNTESIELLRKLGRFVYLAKDKETLMDDFKSRPVPAFLDSDNFEKSFNTMYNQRLAVYQSLAAYTIHTSTLKDTEVLAKLYEIAFKS